MEQTRYLGTLHILFISTTTDDIGVVKLINKRWDYCKIRSTSVTFKGKQHPIGWFYF